MVVEVAFVVVESVTVRSTIFKREEEATDWTPVYKESRPEMAAVPEALIEFVKTKRSAFNLFVKVEEAVLKRAEEET